jgi:hypothetical protein
MYVHSVYLVHLYPKYYIALLYLDEVKNMLGIAGYDTLDIEQDLLHNENQCLMILSS